MFVIDPPQDVHAIGVICSNTPFLLKFDGVNLLLNAKKKRVGSHYIPMPIRSIPYCMDLDEVNAEITISYLKFKEPEKHIRDAMYWFPEPPVLITHGSAGPIFS